VFVHVSFFVHGVCANDVFVHVSFLSMVCVPMCLCGCVYVLVCVCVCPCVCVWPWCVFVHDVRMHAHGVSVCLSVRVLSVVVYWDGAR
jgi:hypothetical protein